MKTLMTIMSAALLTVSVVQMASAGQRDNRKSERNPQIQSQQFRDSNAYYAPDARGYRGDDYGYGYSNRDSNYLDALRAGGATAAPAGR